MAQDELRRIAEELETLQRQIRDNLTKVRQDAAAIRRGKEPTDPIEAFRAVASMPAYLAKLTDLVTELVVALREQGVTGP